MTVQSHAMVSNLSGLLKRMSLPTNDLPNEKRQRMSPQFEKSISLSGMMRELPHKLCRKRKRSSLAQTRELDGNKGISTLVETKELPEEIIRGEILTRLGIKSVVRFKSVCKSWLSLFSDPQFVKEHSAHQNPDDYDCLVAVKPNGIVIFSPYEKTFVLDRDQFQYLIGSANGLVCICSGDTVSLWNPAIRQSKQFHLPWRLDCLKKVGFGFDPVSNDYKVVICYVFFSHLCFAVYSTNSDRWIRQKFKDPAFEIHISKSSQSPTPDTMVRGCPYWTCSTTTKVLSDKNKVNLSLATLKFDATSDTFKLLPEFSSDFNNETTYKAMNTRDLLALVFFRQCKGGEIDVYTLDEKKQCGGWSKMYHFGSLEHFWRIRDLQPGFKYADEIVFYKKKKIYGYDKKSKTSVCIPRTKPVSLRNCFTYTPSLVSLQGMKLFTQRTNSSTRSPPL